MCITDLLLPAVIFKCGIKIMTLHVLFLFCYLMHTSHPGVLSTVEQLVRGFLRFSLDCILLSPRSLIFLPPLPLREFNTVADLAVAFSVCIQKGRHISSVRTCIVVLEKKLKRSCAVVFKIPQASLNF